MLDSVSRSLTMQTFLANCLYNFKYRKNDFLRTVLSFALASCSIFTIAVSSPSYVHYLHVNNFTRRSCNELCSALMNAFDDQGRKKREERKKKETKALQNDSTAYQSVFVHLTNALEKRAVYRRRIDPRVHRTGGILSYK